MTQEGWNIKLEDSDEIAARLHHLNDRIKPHSDADTDYHFYEVIRELAIATQANYQHLRNGYVAIDNPLLAWACRGLLELRVFLKYALISGENARTFAADRLIDGRDIAKALIDLERFHGPDADTPVLNEWLTAVEAQMANEGVASKAPLRASDIAKAVGLNDEYRAMNKVCSKLVHPTGWSVIAMKVGANDYPPIRDTVFGCGVGYLAEIYIEIRDYNNAHDMKPNP